MFYKTLIIILLCFLSICLIKNFKIEFFSKKKCKINIIVPIRDREKELSVFIKNIDRIFKMKNIEYKLYLIEQTHENKLFNRGKLLNIGFLEANKNNFSNYYLMSDVDIYPKTKDIFNIECKKEYRHLYGNTKTAGGVFTIDSNLFKKINGFSNNYWGWGSEDNDLSDRLKLSKIPINLKHRKKRPDSNVGDLQSKPDYQKQKKKMGSNNKLLYHKCKKEYRKNIKNILKDGLRTCNYTVLKKYNYHGKNNIIRILVDI